MKDLTLQDIIRIIPLNKDYRKELLNNLDSYSEEQRFSIREACWNAFFEFKKELEEIKLQQFLQEVESGKRKLSSDMSDQAKLAVWQDFMDILSGKKDELDEIKNIQEKLRNLLNKE